MAKMIRKTIYISRELNERFDSVVKRYKPDTNVGHIVGAALAAFEVLAEESRRELIRREILPSAGAEPRPAKGKRK